MTESEVLLHATAAVLLLCLGFHHLGWAQRLGRAGFSLLIAGALIPLGDLLIFYLRAGGRIGLFTQMPFFSSMFHGTLTIAALAGAAVFVKGPRPAGRIFLLLLAGFLLNQVLGLLTPSGAPLLAPFSTVRPSLPMFFAGHPLLVGALVLVLVLLETLPRYRNPIKWTAVGMLVVYGLAGAGQYLYMNLAARSLAREGARIHVEPVSPWLTRWQITLEIGETYQVRRHGLDLGEFEPPETLERWNDEAMMVRVLGDPTVSRFFYQVFRHPVVRLETTEPRIALIMREAGDLALPAAGRTFLYEADHDGRNRIYRVQRFD